MKNDNDPLDAIIETLLRHTIVLKAMSDGIGCAMSLALHSQKKCDNEDCDKPAIWLNGKIHACDRHRAISILENSSTEESWEELDTADDIRKIEEFIEIKKSAEALYTIH